MNSKYGNQSSIVTAAGLVIALVAIVGTQYLDWEWGSGQLVPTLVAIAAVAGVAIVLVSRRRRQ